MEERCSIAKQESTYIRYKYVCWYQILKIYCLFVETIESTVRVCTFASLVLCCVHFGILWQADCQSIFCCREFQFIMAIFIKRKTERTFLGLKAIVARATHIQQPPNIILNYVWQFSLSVFFLLHSLKYIFNNNEKSGTHLLKKI